MDFIEQLQALASKISKHQELIQTEEAAKNAFVLPFINILGYDIFDPSEVIPEFAADVGTKKGEKVDYAIKRDGKIVILVECKQSDTPLDIEHASQLYRYFMVTDAKIAVLTNGVIYRFFTDLEAPNKMDSKPFMEFNMLEIQEPLVIELKRLTKQSFNLEEIMTVAGELKFTREIKKILAEQIISPSDEFVRLFASQVYSGKITQSVRERFKDLTKRAFAQFINDRINDRLRSAMTDAADKSQITGPNQREVAEVLQKFGGNDEGIITTEEELEGYFVVKAIIREIVDPKRIAQRDMKSYCGILLDDTNRKPICRLRFDGKQKYIGLFNSDKQEERVAISTVDDIYRLASRLRETVLFYEKKPDQEPV